MTQNINSWEQGFLSFFSSKMVNVYQITGIDKIFLIENVALFFWIILHSYFELHQWILF